MCTLYLGLATSQNKASKTHVRVHALVGVELGRVSDLALPVSILDFFLVPPVLRMMEVVVTIGAIRHAWLQSNQHHQQTNIQFFTGQMPFLSPNQQCRSTEGKLC